MTQQNDGAPAQVGFFGNIINYLESEAATIWSDVKTEAVAIEPDVVAAFDALWNDIAPFAVKAAQEVEQAALNGSLLNSEKRSALFTKLFSKAESLGYSVGQNGLTSALNLAVEFAVGIMKMITGQSVGKPANAAA